MKKSQCAVVRVRQVEVIYPLIIPKNLCPPTKIKATIKVKTIRQLLVNKSMSLGWARPSGNLLIFFFVKIASATGLWPAWSLELLWLFASSDGSGK